jgi:hypothetical protein
MLRDRNRGIISVAMQHGGRLQMATHLPWQQDA